MNRVALCKSRRRSYTRWFCERSSTFLCPLFPGRRICGQAIVQREGAILKVPYLATAAEGDPWKRVRKSLLRRTQASGKQKGFHATSERDAQSMQDIIYLLRQKGRGGDGAIAGAALERAKKARYTTRKACKIYHSLSLRALKPRRRLHRRRLVLSGARDRECLACFARHARM